MEKNIPKCPSCRLDFNLQQKYPIVLAECDHVMCLECTNQKAGVGYQCRFCPKSSKKIALHEDIIKLLLMPSNMEPCGDHGKSLDYLCKNCEKRCCADCCASTHRSHTCKLFADIYPQFEKKRADLKNFIKLGNKKVEELHGYQRYYEHELLLYVDEVFKSFAAELEMIQRETKKKISEFFKKLTFPHLYTVGNEKLDITVYIETAKDLLKTYPVGKNNIFGLIDEKLSEQAMNWHEKVDENEILKEIEKAKLTIKLPDIPSLMKFEVFQEPTQVDVERTMRKIKDSLFLNDNYYDKITKDERKMTVLTSLLQFEKTKRAHAHENLDLDQHFGSLDIEPILPKKMKSQSLNNNKVNPQTNVIKKSIDNLEIPIVKCEREIQTVHMGVDKDTQTILPVTSDLEYVIYSDKQNYFVMKLLCPEFEIFKKFDAQFMEYDNKAYFNFEITARKDPNKEGREDRIYDTRNKFDSKFHTIKLNYQDFELIDFDKHPEIVQNDGCITFTYKKRENLNVSRHEEVNLL